MATARVIRRRHGGTLTGSLLPYTKKNKILHHCLTLASMRIAPKICQGQWQTMFSECPKFHSNRFTSGGVIAERVNTVETRDKVNPILSDAIASRRVHRESKKGATLIMAITLSILDRFAKFCYCCKEQ